MTPNALPAGTGAITLFVLLRAFSSGSTALTGVEAIANGVNAFRRPHGRNAALTLATLGVIAITLFLGVSYLAVQLHAAPSSTDSVVSQIGRAVFPAGSRASFMYYAVQGLTLIVLILAANTSFQGFPRLSALLARDRFAPRQFTNLGDRLVFSNGMVVLATVAAAAALDLRRQHERPDPPLRDRRLHSLHALAGGDGAVLAARARPRLAGEAARQRGRGDGDGSRDYGRRLHEVRRGCLARHRRDSAPRPGDARHPPALRSARAPAARRRGRRPRGACCAEHDAAARGVSGRGEWGGAPFANEIADGRCARCTSPTPHRSRDPPAVVQAHRGTALESLDSRLGVTEAVLEQVWRLPRGESDFVTVVVPELFDRESLLEQAKHPREFALKFRLLSEPGVVVADVPVVREAAGRRAAAAGRPRPRIRRQRGFDAGRQLRPGAGRRRRARRPFRLQRG